MPKRLPDYAIRNREVWTLSNANWTAANARDSWAQQDITWGKWHTPESEIKVLPKLLGLDVIELGCGTAYFGAWLKRHGARRVVGVDITPAQLDTAREMNDEFGLGLEFLKANAEDVPLPDASFDLAFSEYGASLWCDPERWIPEAARLLRRGGELVFMRSTDLEMVCSADTEHIGKQLVRPLKGMHRLDWTDDEVGESTEFHVSHSELFQILRWSGFDVLDFRELYAPEDAVDHPYYQFVTAEWARQWPSEEIWRARKTRAAASARPGRKASGKAPARKRGKTAEPRSASRQEP
jgi:ubiquinone/menaquinone biosynthesis C-methylase UbiE